MRQFKINNINLLEVVTEMVKRKDLKTLSFDTETIGFTVFGLDAEMRDLQLALDEKKIDYEILI